MSEPMDIAMRLLKTLFAPPSEQGDNPAASTLFDPKTGKVGRSVVHGQPDMNPEEATRQVIHEDMHRATLPELGIENMGHTEFPAMLGEEFYLQRLAQEGQPHRKRDPHTLESSDLISQALYRTGKHSSVPKEQQQNYLQSWRDRVNPIKEKGKPIEIAWRLLKMPPMWYFDSEPQPPENKDFTMLQDFGHHPMGYDQAWESDDGVARGIAVPDHNDGTWAITHFEIADDLQGLGAGQQYLQRFIDELRETEYPHEDDAEFHPYDGQLDPYDVHVVQVEPHAEGFWNKMVDRGVLHGAHGTAWIRENVDGTHYYTHAYDREKMVAKSEDNPLLQYLTPELLGGINESGGTMYQTGGSLRDSYIGGLDSKDLDLLVHGMDKEELGDLLQQHGDVDFVGAQHGVFKFRPHGMEGEPFDIGVPRREVSTGEGHSDYEMSFDKDMPLEDEQLRRDFWMNAMMRNIHTGELHDIDGRGLHDIKNQQISVVNPKAFSEDPLRMLRAVQFASRFGFNIEPETLKHIQDSAHKINTVHPDRFNAEFLKLFEKSKRPSDGVDLLHQTGITNHILHDAQSTEIMNHIPKSAYGAFLAEMAQNYGDDAKEYLQSALNISNKDAITAQAVIDWKNNQPLNNNWDVVQFYNKIRGDPYIMHNIDAHSHASEIIPLSSQLDYIREQGIPTNLKELNVNGKDLMNLGYRGIEIGNSLNELFEYAVRNQTNDKEHLLSLASDKLQKSTQPLYARLSSANTMKPFERSFMLLKSEGFIDNLIKMGKHEDAMQLQAMRQFVLENENSSDPAMREAAEEMYQYLTELMSHQSRISGGNMESVAPQMPQVAGFNAPPPTPPRPAMADSAQANRPPGVPPEHPMIDGDMKTAMQKAWSSLTKATYAGRSGRSSQMGTGMPGFMRRPQEKRFSAEDEEGEQQEYVGDLITEDEAMENTMNRLMSRDRKDVPPPPSRQSSRHAMMREMEQGEREGAPEPPISDDEHSAHLGHSNKEALAELFGMKPKGRTLGDHL